MVYTYLESYHIPFASGQSVPETYLPHQEHVAWDGQMAPSSYKPASGTPRSLGQMLETSTSRGIRESNKPRMSQKYLGFTFASSISDCLQMIIDTSQFLHHPRGEVVSVYTILFPAILYTAFAVQFLPHILSVLLRKKAVFQAFRRSTGKIRVSTQLPSALRKFITYSYDATQSEAKGAASWK